MNKRTVYRCDLDNPDAITPRTSCDHCSCEQFAEMKKDTLNRHRVIVDELTPDFTDLLKRAEMLDFTIHVDRSNPHHVRAEVYIPNGLSEFPETDARVKFVKALKEVAIHDDSTN